MNISSFLIGYQAGKNAGGGSSADVRYVTFMSYDGSIEYGKKAVAVGDDCADPIARGVFDTPTRESTAQYSYSFYGWATTPNGGADANWNKAITEDKTVYANFSSAVRSYTITYLDTDGSVLKTDTLLYGSMPEYVPEKSGFSFDGWEPALATVKGDATYTAKWIEAITFAGASWEDIVRIAEAGEAQTYFKIGDQKTIDITTPSGETKQTTLQIAGFDKDELADGTGTAAITIMAVRAPFRQPHTAASYTIYDWQTSQVRESLNGVVFNSFPEALRNGIKSVKKISRKYVDGTTLTGILTTTEKVWQPSAIEYAAGGDQTNYGYYPEKTADGAIYYSGLSAQSVVQQGLTDFNISDNGTLRVTFRSAGAKSKYNCLAYDKSGTLYSKKSVDASSNGLIVFGFCI